MDNRKRSAGSSDTGNMLHWSSSFLRQPAQVLIVEAVPPWWSENCKVVCDALDNFLSLACSLDGPCRIPLLSLYAISRQQECLLPFVVRSGSGLFLRAFSSFNFLSSPPFVASCHTHYLITSSLCTSLAGSWKLCLAGFLCRGAEVASCWRLHSRSNQRWRAASTGSAGQLAAV